MAEYIKLEDAIEVFEWTDADVCEDFGDGCNFGFSREVVRDELKRVHVADVVPVRHARWVDRYGGKYINSLYECSLCEGEALYGDECLTQKLSDFCPHCGAMMDGGI